MTTCSQRTSVYVRAPPCGGDEAQQSKLRNKLMIHFQKSPLRKNSDVNDVRIISSSKDDLWMRVTFSDPSGVENVLASDHFELQVDEKTISLNVQANSPTPGSSLTSVDSDSDLEILTMESFHICDDGTDPSQSHKDWGDVGQTPSSSQGDTPNNPFESSPHEVENAPQYAVPQSAPQSRAPLNVPPGFVVPQNVPHFTAARYGSSYTTPLGGPAWFGAIRYPPPLFGAHTLPLPTRPLLYTDPYAVPPSSKSPIPHPSMLPIGTTASAPPDSVHEESSKATPNTWDSSGSTSLTSTQSTNIQGTDGEDVHNAEKQVSDTGASCMGQVVSDTGEYGQGSFPPYHQPSSLAGIWTPKPGEASVGSEIWPGFDPRIPWYSQPIRPAPGMRPPTLGRGFVQRGVSGSQEYRAVGIAPSHLRGSSPGTSMQQGTSAAGQYQPFLPGNLPVDNTAAVSHPMGPNIKVPGTAVRTRPVEDARGLTDEDDVDDQKEEQDDEEEEQLVVEVTGFKSTTSEEMLKLYFENPRKSKGGDIETWEKDAKTEAIKIKFTDPSVAKAVVGKNHNVGGANLTVRLIVKKKPRPRPIKKRCLFLKGIPDGCPAELVSLYIENRSGMDDPKIEYGEIPGTALCTFAQDIPDLQSIIRKVSLKKLQGAQVTAEMVHESDCILIQGLTDAASLELIELYFDNKKKSGGSDVRDVQPGPADGQAIVYFEDWKVVGDVLSKKGPHKFGNAELSVEEYHDNLGRLSSSDAPTPHIPKPVSMRVPEEIMEFIFGKGKRINKKLIKELRKVNAIPYWPNGDNKTEARLEPLVEHGQSQSWLNWSKISAEVLTDILKECTSITVPIPAPLWKDVRDALAKCAFGNCSMTLGAHTHSAHVVGEQQDVDMAVANIKNTIKELQAKAAHDAQQTKQEVVLAPEKLNLFTRCGIRDKIERSFQDLKVSILPLQGQMGLILEGTVKNAQKAELLMRREMDALSNVEMKTGNNKVRFVQNVSDKIHEILGSKGIHAACSISTDGKITIHGATKTDVAGAKAYIDQEIEEDVIRINGPAVSAALKGQNGMKLLAAINKQKFVMVDINQQSGNVELSGFKTELKDSKQHILAFLKDNVKMKRSIGTGKSKVRLITSFHGQELTRFTTQQQRDHVVIQPQMSGRNAGFIMEGNAEGLDAAIQFINQLVARIQDKQYPVSKTGMAQLFREDKGKKFLESVEKKLQCVIDVVGEKESDEEEDLQDWGGMSVDQTSTAITEVLCRITLPDGCTLRVCKGDLTKQKVDCIVNAANVNLRHSAGLAADIIRAGGQVIQTECDHILKTRRRQLYIGEPVYTSSGNLPCKKVIHVAGPIWSQWKMASQPDDEPTHEEHLLFDAVLACLKLANKLKFQSVAIPAISTGVFGFPVKLAAVQIANAVDEFCQKVTDSSLTEISLTNHDQPTCDVVKQAVMSQFGHLVEADSSTLDIAAGARGAPMTDDKPAVVAPMFTPTGQNILTTNEGITVTLKKGSITDEQADVIVNTSGSDLNLSAGYVSQAILKIAGPALQQECTALIAARGKIAPGSFIDTGAGAMTTCKKIFHCVIDRYNPAGNSDKTLKTLVESLLQQAQVIEVLSLAIPALGTGNLGYPADVTARVMYEAVSAFSRQNPSGVLKDIRFVVYDKDIKTIKGFEDEIKRLTTGATEGATGKGISKRKLKKSVTTSSAVDDRQSYSQIHQGPNGMLQAKIGSVCLQISPGDLAKETSQAIVNSVGENLDLQGPVSTALLNIGGNKIKKECDDHRKKDPTKSVYVTTAGKLQSKILLHVVTPKTPEDVKTIVAETLQKAESRRMKSISFPALGTGPQAGQAVGPCASAMLSAIGVFACRQKPRHLHLIRLVIFKQDMLPEFEAALRQEEGRSYKKQTSLLTRGWDWAKSFMPGAAAEEKTSDDEALQETILLRICAMDGVTIEKATDEIDQYQDEEFRSEDIPDHLGMIAKMTEEHQAELKNIERKYNVHIELSKGHAKFIRVEGRTLSVKDALFGIQELFTRMQVQETKKQRSEHLTKEVQWKYSTAAGVEDYDAEINVIIEDAYQKKQPTVTLDLEEGRVTIDFALMQEMSRGGNLNINRVDLQQAAKFEIPSNWIPMTKGEHFQLVQLTAGTQEYTDVEAVFRTSMDSAPMAQIDEILRIQNKDLMMQYQARKAAMGARLGRTDIEETLYHGTDEQTCDQINKFGFNRSFCGKNATVYGNGTYFAVAASYSARSAYAKPNASNTKHIYASKVLVGDYTTGTQGMLVPPNKPNNPDQLFDSVVNDVNNPAIYVIFHDAQAYPQHLIKYK